MFLSSCTLEHGRLLRLTWPSYQIRKIAGRACAGNAGNVFPATACKRSRHVSRHDFLCSWWRGKRSRHSRRMRNPQFYASGKRAMWALTTFHVPVSWNDRKCKYIYVFWNEFRIEEVWLAVPADATNTWALAVTTLSRIIKIITSVM